MGGLLHLVQWGEGWAGSLLAVPNVTAHTSTASVPTSYYSMRQLPSNYHKGLILLAVEGVVTFLNPRYMIWSSLRENFVVLQSASSPSGLHLATCFSVSSSSWSDRPHTHTHVDIHVIFSFWSRRSWHFSEIYFWSYLWKNCIPINRFTLTTKVKSNINLISRLDRRTLPPEPRRRCKTLPPIYSIYP